MSAGKCASLRYALGAYVDEELSGAERIRISEHIATCSQCAAEVASLSELGEALRGRAVDTRELDFALAGLAGGVTSRIRAEQSQSWGAVWNRVFDDWHWVAIGLGSVAGAMVSFVFASAILASSIVQLTQMNARAGTLYLIALPQDGRGQAVMLEFEESLGSARSDARQAMPASLGWQAERALVTALDETLTRSGRPASLRGLSRAEREEILALLSEIADFRNLEPPRRPGGLTNVVGMHLHVSTSVTASGI